MGAMKHWYSTIAIKFSDEELHKAGWSEENIRWLRECFGY